VRGSYRAIEHTRFDHLIHPTPEEISMAATAVLKSVDPAVQPALGELDDDDALYEEANGLRIKTARMSCHAALVASELLGDLSIHIHKQIPSPGRLVVEVLFKTPLQEDAGRKRRPDLAFVSFDRWPIDRPMSSTADAWNVVPDLAVEVTSPIGLVEELLHKVADYFRAGVRLVWVVYPNARCIHVYEAWNRIRVVTESDTLDGGTVLPGFRLALDRLFGPVEPVIDSA
jgi:Uma2 family endonuclease